MKILVTGAAGFIGFHLSKQLIESGHEVVGIDNINNYYDINLKYARLKELGITNVSDNNFVASETFGDSFHFIKMNLEDEIRLPEIFRTYSFDTVCNLAAQAGVRYSIENPMKYINSNLVGFTNLLECVRNSNIKKFMYASSSSVYGMNKKTPFSTEDSVDKPISIYAATKKSNELIAHTYSYLHGIETIGLRFFTVYGPWGRPDMAMFLFTDSIINNKPIKVFNNGNLSRDFTYIDDIIRGLTVIIENNTLQKDYYRIYNIGNGSPVRLNDFISEIEISTGKKAIRIMESMQPGDVIQTWADTRELHKDYNYIPSTKISEGVKKFVNWYRKFYSLD